MNNNLPSTSKWWCYGCSHILSATDSTSASPCYGCQGHTSKPYYHWGMKGLIENNKYCVRCKHFDRDIKQCIKHDDVEQLEYPAELLRACDDWKHDYMYWQVGRVE